MLTVAIIGRPNVGKSTLFNRLTGEQRALVHNLPGVTRDRREGMGEIGPLQFRVIDTAGLEEGEPGSLEQRMMAQTEAALQEADLALLVVDARAGITPEDEYFAGWLRKRNKPVLLLANKTEGKYGMENIHDFYGLGFGDPVPVSASHGLGLGGLFEALEEIQSSESGVQSSEEQVEGAVQIAIVGRPNAGKSTLMNALLGEERVIAGPEAGMTRDAIAIDWEYHGRPITLIDTAGLRRKSKVTAKLEKLAVDDALRSVQYAHVVVLLVDANMPLEKQDLQIADHVIEEGRALVVAANKWDTVEDKDARRQEITWLLEDKLSQVKGVPLVTLSALRGRGLEKLLGKALEVYDLWNKRIPTSKLNAWLEAAVERHPPPVAKGKRIKLRYISQVNTRPPTFALFCSQPKQLPESYRRYISGGLREAFDLPGVPIRVMLRGGKNPYVK